MKIRPLRRLNQADLSNDVMHFTDRWGKDNIVVPPEILKLDARQRLEAILAERRIHAFQTFFTCGTPVVCFTEATREGMQALINGMLRRYVPWGIGFSKDFILHHGGGPAFYVRGDRWDDFAASDLPGSVKAFGTMFWPGVELEEGEGAARTLTKQNEWAHEREWRVPFEAEGAALTFAYSDVSTVVAPSIDAWGRVVTELGLQRDLGHVTVIDIPGPEKPPRAEVASAEPDAEDAYDDPRIRRMLGLAPRNVEDMMEE